MIQVKASRGSGITASVVGKEPVMTQTGENTIIGRSPYISEGGTWVVWDAQAGAYTDTGLRAQGRDGVDGLPGRDGADGAPGRDGADGAPGKDGADGAPGKDGADGKDYVLTDTDKQDIADMVDAVSDAVKDVQVNGSSIVTDGVATLPIASTGNFGVTRVGSGIGLSGDKKIILVVSSESTISNRSVLYAALSPKHIDYAVKAAMCDGKGAAWTADEQKAARERIGLPGDYELIEETTLEEDVAVIFRNTETDGTPYNFTSVACFVTLPNGNTDRSIAWNYNVNGNGMSTHWISTKSEYALYLAFYANVIGGRLFCRNALARTGAYGGSNIGNQPKSVSELGYYPAASISSIRVKEANGVGYPAGTIIQIYGVRA